MLNAKSSFLNKEKKINGFKVFAIVIFVLGLICRFLSNWAIYYFGGITPEQIIFTLTSPVKGADMSAIGISFIVPACRTLLYMLDVFTVFTIMYILYTIYIAKKNNEDIKMQIKKINKKVINLLITLSLCIVGSKCIYDSINQLDLFSVIKAYANPSTYIEDNYVDPNSVKLSFPEKKRNLIHIYLESIETSYLSKELGGHMEENLMPELTELMKEGVTFSHNEKYGGPRVTHASEWTIAGIVNMECGIPLKSNLSHDGYGANSVFLPGVTNIGDILKKEGYNQKLVIGSDSDFAAKTTYFKTHGDYEIFDLKTAKEEGLIPEDYNVWWGYEDDKLFEYAKKELLELAEKGEPFNFRMETADTHFPDGYLSEKAEKKYDSQYANVIAYSTKQAVEFVRWIQEQDFYENTTIVITGDHLSMDVDFFNNFDKDYERNVFNLILNGTEQTENTKNRDFAAFDLFPTILASIGVDIENNKLGLGTNLFSNEKTLIEVDGLDVVNEKLGSYSEFYINRLLKAADDKK